MPLRISAPLLEQWIAQLGVFLGLSKREIGRNGGSRHKVTGALDVAMIQSLARRPDLKELVEPYGHVSGTATRVHASGPSTFLLISKNVVHNSHIGVVVSRRMRKCRHRRTTGQQ